MGDEHFLYFFTVLFYIWLKDWFESFLKVKMEVPCLLIQSLLHSSRSVTKTKKEGNTIWLEGQGKVDSMEIIFILNMIFKKLWLLIVFSIVFIIAFIYTLIRETLKTIR